MARMSSTSLGDETEGSSGDDYAYEGNPVAASIRQQILQAAKAKDSDTLEKILKNDLKGREDRKWAVNCVDWESLSPLHHAVRNNHLALVKVLIENGAVVNQETLQKYTPLHLAAKYIRSREGTKEGVKGGSESEEDGIINYLINNNAKRDAKDSYGSTPLHVAAMKDNRHLVEEFEKSKDPNERTNELTQQV
ncbi:ankyrin repeat domain-containing protein 49-like [Ptychodera flava]|uniref:ankyrin repeat domain-containing protein 49-like n=1 Tax=Ptychodera flava TaxID=63121 RepID=UPI00396AA431